MKECPYWISQMGNGYEYLYNWIDRRNWKSMKWLQFLGFELITPPIKLNSFKVFRFVRCKGDKILINKEEQPIQC